MSTLEEKFAALRSRLQDPGIFHGFEIANPTNISILDYAPHEEMEMRARLGALLQEKPESYRHFNLYGLFVGVCEQKRFTQKQLDTVVARAGLAKAMGNICRFVTVDQIADSIKNGLTSEQDIAFLTGVGEAHPMLDIFNLLNVLPVVVEQPIIVLYPGTYTGHELRLLNTLPPQNYYRASHVH